LLLLLLWWPFLGLQAGWPDWANFRIIVRLFSFGVLLKYKSSPNVWDTFFYGKSSALFWDKKWVGQHFGRLFSQTHLVTLLAGATPQAYKAHDGEKLSLLSTLTFRG
jgi:hypothetical protein